MLNTKNQVLAIQTISVGTVNQSQVRPAEVFRPAVRINAPSIIAVQNHPTGDPTPSRDDFVMTRELVSAGRILGVESLDHIVIGQRRNFSPKDRGPGFLSLCCPFWTGKAMCCERLSARCTGAQLPAL
jgi:DNA repair protein RadC